MDNIFALDRLSLRDDISELSISKHRKVSFDSIVKAATIPSRLSYSDRMKARLWSSTEDIYSNAVRNEKEFAFDGSNWRTASEESDFLRCPFASSISSDDVFVHPVHFTGMFFPRPHVEHSQVILESGQVSNADEAAENYDDISEGIFDMD